MKSETGRGDKECKRGRNGWMVKSEIEDEDWGRRRGGGKGLSVITGASVKHLYTGAPRDCDIGLNMHKNGIVFPRGAVVMQAQEVQASRIPEIFFCSQSFLS